MRTVDENAEMVALASLVTGARECGFCGGLPATVHGEATTMMGGAPWVTQQIRCDECASRKDADVLYRAAGDLPIARFVRRLYALLKCEAAR